MNVATTNICYHPLKCRFVSFKILIFIIFGFLKKMNVIFCLRI